MVRKGRRVRARLDRLPNPERHGSSADLSNDRAGGAATASAARALTSVRLVSIEFENWLPYRGRHRIDLGPTAYAVTARRVGDEAASNWAGKSALLAAVRFALYGEHPADTEDEWITRGESEGRVALVLSDGSLVERTRFLGEATRLRVRRPDGSELARDPAEEEIERRIGLSRRDFDAVAYFAQKRVHRFVAARPAERFADVAAWVRLGPLRQAEEDERRRLAGLADRETRAAARAQLVRERLGNDPAGAVEAARSKAARAAAEAASAADVLARAAKRAEESRERRALAAAAGEHASSSKELDDLRSRPAARRLSSVEPLRKALDEAVGVRRLAFARREQARSLARAEFDGACPVAGIACPARDAINARTAENVSRAAEAERSFREADDRSERARDALRSAERRAAEEEQRRSRIAWLEKQVSRTAGASERLAELGPPSDREPDPVLAASLAALAAGRAAEADAELRRAEADAGDLRRAEEELGTIRREARTAREAAAILGRAGAQRRLAERAVRAIERGANERLAAAGVRLSARLSWGRETADLASHCDACGEPFPASRTARACQCGAERGPKVVDELGCELSSVSGAAEDLAGVALSLAAAAWVRAERQAAWACALVDEPFGALDEPNRRAMARLISGALSPAGGFEQALVVAHHESAIEALPGRIRITSGPRGSWVRVV